MIAPNAKASRSGGTPAMIGRTARRKSACACGMIIVTTSS